MNNLFNAMTNGDARTANGAVTNSTSGSHLVDLFGRAGSSRGTDLTGLFHEALKEDEDLAIRMLMYVRDPRGGYGERKHFRQWLAHLVTILPEQVSKRVIQRVPEIGRFDDLIPVIEKGGNLARYAIAVWIRAIAVNKNALAAKWMPRKGKIFNAVRRFMQVPPKTLRKLLVETTNVVETKMCEREWDKIEYDKLPSRAQLIYRKAFNRNDGTRYQEYLSDLEAGDSKVNSSVLYPYEVLVKSEGALQQAQWESLPDYVEGGVFLPVIDVSGSMYCSTSVQGVTALDAAMSLGIYLAERNKSVFKDQFVTFSERPQMHSLVGRTLRERCNNLRTADWGMSTNIDSVFTQILSKAVEHNLSNDDLPDAVIILSDMEFNYCGGRPVSEKVKARFEKYGYKVPKQVFWNLHSRAGNVPVKVDQHGTVLVSGLSGAVMKSVLSNKVLTPLDMLKETLLVPKYDY